mmetsp:Transcript_53922/g.99630  ORF Transcript_53922/g.99630 Transcript_53922/m.99630 type:complete len:462 (-) Transcript_53922:67-1452(-)
MGRLTNAPIGNVPWWACIAIAFAGIEYTTSERNWSRSTTAEPTAQHAVADLRRRLETASAEDAVPSSFNLTVPCVGLLSFQVISPCGNLTVPEDGITFKSLFGEHHLPGTAALKDEVKLVELKLQRYTVAFVVIGGIIWLLTTCCITSNRNKFIKSVKDTFAGKLDDEEEDEEDPPTEEEKKARLDPLSSEFIAPGNIYRLLAVLHPGILGISSWLKYAFKAGICAYMQIYLPYNVIKKVFRHWTLVGIKSPLWFLSNATTFTSMVAALGSLCSMFAGKCAKSIEDGAQANVYILTHKNPNPGGGGGSRSARDGGYATLIDKPPMGETMIYVFEVFWCSISMLLNIVMSIMLELAMFLQVATFTGEVSDVAITAVSLYFIFDLDDKVMEADPKLRLKYRRAVAKQTEEKPGEHHPWIMPLLASTSAAFVKLTVPFGLLGIVLFAWANKQSKFVIGGDGLTM